MREKGMVSLAAAATLTPRDQLKFKTPSGKIEIESDTLKKAGLPSLAPYQAQDVPGGDRFHLLFGRPATLSHGQSLNNPILNEVAPEQLLWIHPNRAKPLGIADGDDVEIESDSEEAKASGRRSYSAFMKAKVTPWIHPDAVFMLHGYGATVPLATRACGLGVADQSLQHGKLYQFDPAGGGNAMTETIVQVRPRRSAK
jgi:thiosulfate reductase/polysulfide reductase chain A